MNKPPLAKIGWTLLSKSDSFASRILLSKYNNFLVPRMSSSIFSSSVWRDHRHRQDSIRKKAVSLK